MAKDKTIDYHILKNLHYQNVYSHFIYRNTQQAMMKQRNANFWGIAEIPLLILTIVNLFIVLLTYNWIIIGSSVFISIIGSVFFGYLIYNQYIKKKNQHDKEVMDFNSVLISIQNLQDQVEIIDCYSIPHMDTRRKLKIEEIKSLIDKNLVERFRRFQDQSHDYTITFLCDLRLDPSRLRERLTILRDFMKGVSENHEEKRYFRRLNTIIQYLYALDNEDEDENIIIQSLFEVQI